MVRLEESKNIIPRRAFFKPDMETTLLIFGTQTESTIETMFKSEKVALRQPLGALLGRFWRISEAILRVKKRVAVLENILRGP